MTRRQGISAALLSAALWLSAATVSVRDGNVHYAYQSPLTGRIDIDFAPCMANELYTFSSVSIDGEVVNRTTSDNIGPFGLVGGGWSGGNHLNAGMRSARTDSVRICLDGHPVCGDLADADCSVLAIDVYNTLLMPADTAVFAREHMRYVVAANSIDVAGEHRFAPPRPVTVDRYYGMQSMMDGETEMLTPGGRYRRWTPIAEVDRFDKLSAPEFSIFVEHSPRGYQAAWMDPATDLGDRHLVPDTDWVFIGNSWSKAYHKIIGSHTVHPGDTTRWHGVYSWFAAPMNDADGSMAFHGSVGGTPVVFYISNNGNTQYLRYTKP